MTIEQVEVNVLSEEVKEFLYDNPEAFNIEIGCSQGNYIQGASKIYEYRQDGNLVAFIILMKVKDDYNNDADAYEINFGKLSGAELCFGKQIFEPFIASYNEILPIYAVVRKENPNKDKIFRLLESAKFKRNDKTDDNEYIFNPN